MMLTPEELQRRHIRRSQYIACDDAFIDVRLPGSSPKHNYSIIGPGVTQNAEQPINLREPHGFNIGAAGLPPGVTNNLHLHFTAEVFIACEGRFLVRWGVRGDEGELVMEAGDVICIPTWIFRGFSNIGSTPGFLMTVLGGDDTGGILWSPDVLHRARATGLWLGRDNQMIDVPPGAAAPPENTLMPPLPDAEVAKLRHWPVAEMAARCVKPGQRHFLPATLDSVLPGHAWEIAPVIGWGLSQHREHRPAVSDPQGFSLEWIRLPPGAASAPFVLDAPAVLVHADGPLAVVFNETIEGHAAAGSPSLRAELGAWDTLSLPAGCTRRFANTGTATAEALLVVQGDTRKAPRYGTDVSAAALHADFALDAGGYVARASLLPPAVAA